MVEVSNRFDFSNNCKNHYHTRESTEEEILQQIERYTENSNSSNNSVLQQNTGRPRTVLATETNCIVCKSSTAAIEEKRNNTKIAKIKNMALFISMCIAIPIGLTGIIAIAPMLLLLVALLTNGPYGVHTPYDLSVSDKWNSWGTVAIYGALITAICVVVIVSVLLPPSILHLVEIKRNKEYFSTEQDVSIFSHSILTFMRQKATEDQAFKNLLETVTMTDQGIKNILTDEITKKLIYQTSSAYKKLYNLLAKINKFNKSRDTDNHDNLGEETRKKIESIIENFQNQEKELYEKFSYNLNQLLLSLFSNIYNNSIVKDKSNKTEILNLFKHCVGDSIKDKTKFAMSLINSLSEYLKVNGNSNYNEELINTTIVEKFAEKSLKCLDLDALDK